MARPINQLRIDGIARSGGRAHECEDRGEVLTRDGLGVMLEPVDRQPLDQRPKPVPLGSRD